MRTPILNPTPLKDWKWLFLRAVTFVSLVYFIRLLCPALVQSGRARGIITETKRLFVRAHRNSPCQKNHFIPK